VSDEHRHFVEAIAADLRARAPRALVVAGERQPAAVHALAAAINESLGAQGTTVVYVEPPVAHAGVQGQSLRRLTADMQEGRVSLLAILGGNPVYTAPADLDFRAAMERVAVRVHLSLYQDETDRPTARCRSDSR
jgi:molybdopterin-containing oxidoreductase family iron-sulfur binding subunit